MAIMSADGPNRIVTCADGDIAIERSPRSAETAFDVNELRRGNGRARGQHYELLPDMPNAACRPAPHNAAAGALPPAFRDAILAWKR